jgi:hypothetical protein
VSRQLFRKRDLPGKLRCGKTTVNKLIETDPTFPRLFPLTDGGRGQFGFEDELDRYLEARAARAASRTPDCTDKAASQTPALSGFGMGAAQSVGLKAKS